MLYRSNKINLIIDLNDECIANIICTENIINLNLILL